MYIYVCIYICICIYIYIYVCIYIYIYICIYMYIYLYAHNFYMYYFVYIYMYVCMYVCMCVCVYICMYVCMYIHSRSMNTASTVSHGLDWRGGTAYYSSKLSVVCSGHWLLVAVHDLVNLRMTEPAEGPTLMIIMASISLPIWLAALSMESRRKWERTEDHTWPHMTTHDHRWPQMTIDHCHSLFQGLLLQSHGCVWICRMLFLEISAAFSQRSKHVSHSFFQQGTFTRLQAPAWILRPQGCILEIRWLEMDQRRSQRNLSDYSLVKPVS